MLVGAQKWQTFGGPAGGCGLAGSRGAPWGELYGGMGVVWAKAMRSVLPNKGNKTIRVRTAPWTRIEMASARRRTLRCRVRCSASPSTRQPRNEPRFSSGIFSGAFWGSRGITHLQKIFCKRGSFHRHAERNRRDFAAPISWGCSSSPGDQRRARRDVRLRASSLGWTPRRLTSSLGDREELPEWPTNANWTAVIPVTYFDLTTYRKL